MNTTRLGCHAPQAFHRFLVDMLSRAVSFDTNGTMSYLEVSRMVQLSQHTAILTGGAAEGSEMCRALKLFIEEEALNDAQEVYGAALPFLAGEYEKFMRRECEVIPLDPIHHVYFILGGCSERDKQKPFRLYLLWTKKKLPQLDGDEIAYSFTAPRIMGLEYRLNQLCKEEKPLDQILAEARSGMKKMAQAQEEIGPPFSYAFITEEGFMRVD
jgi:hypothetical protein